MKHTQKSKHLAWTMEDKHQLKGIDNINHLGSTCNKCIQELEQLMWTIKKRNQRNYNPTRLRAYMKLKEKLPRI
jgi:bacterioferritin-associated ferredoxin